MAIVRVKMLYVGDDLAYRNGPTLPRPTADTVTKLREARRFQYAAQPRATVMIGTQSRPVDMKLGAYMCGRLLGAARQIFKPRHAWPHMTMTPTQEPPRFCW